MLSKVTTQSRNGNNGNGHQPPARPMDVSERDDLRWWLRVVRECRDNAPYLVEFRGRQFGADPDLAAAVLLWGGRLVQQANARRGGRS